MNKEELIKLKQELEKKRKEIKERTYQKRYLVWNTIVSCGYTLEQIEKMTNLEKAIELIERYYEEVIKQHIEKDCDFDSIELELSFSNITQYYLEEENKVYEDRENRKCLPNLIAVQIPGYKCKKNGVSLAEEDMILPDELFEENYDEYIVPYNEFISALQERGFEFDEILSVEDIKESNILGGSLTISKLILDLTKNKQKKKRL